MSFVSIFSLCWLLTVLLQVENNDGDDDNDDDVNTNNAYLKFYHNFRIHITSSLDSFLYLKKSINKCATVNMNKIKMM